MERTLGQYPSPCCGPHILLEALIPHTAALCVYPKLPHVPPGGLTQQPTGWAPSQGRVIAATRAWPGGPPTAAAWPPTPCCSGPQHLIQIVHQLQLGPAFILQPCELPPPGAHVLLSGGPGGWGWGCSRGRRSCGCRGAGGHLLLGQPAHRGDGRRQTGGRVARGEVLGLGSASPRGLLPPLLLLGLLPLLPPPRLLGSPLLPFQQAGPLLGHLVLGLVFILGAGTGCSWLSLPWFG